MVTTELLIVHWLLVVTFRVFYASIFHLGYNPDVLNNRSVSQCVRINVNNIVRRICEKSCTLY